MRKIFYCTTFIIVLGLGLNTNIKTKQNTSSVYLENIECLATGESTSNKCIGIGNLDCPISKEKVVIYFNE
jgi:hypothetical protein